MLANAMRGLATEFGLTVPKGIGRLEELMVLVDADETFPVKARQAIAGLLEQCQALTESIVTFEAEIVAHARHDETARRLATIPGIGPITASLIAATVGDIGMFKSARQFAAWLGLVPRQHSTGGKTRLGRITKTGNREIRKLLVLGATSMVYRAAQWNSAAGALDQRDPRTPPRPAGDRGTGEQDGAHRMGVDDAQGGLPGERACRCRARRDVLAQDGGRRAQARLIRQEALNRVMGKAVVKNSSGNTGSSLVPRARPTDWCLTRKRTPMMASGKCRATGRT